MEDYEDCSISFWFIVTGKYLAVYYDGTNFELRRDHHGRGTIFYLSNNYDKIIHNDAYIAELPSHPDYDGDVFYIVRDSKYLSLDGQWVDSVEDAVHVQIEPIPEFSDGQIPIPEPITNPIIDPNGPISADGIDLFLPDRWFQLYAITGDSLWLGDADEFNDILVFRGNPYSSGMAVQLSKHEGKTRIRFANNKYLTVMMEAEVASYLPEECKQHTSLTRCSKCMRQYDIGFSSEPQECFSLVPKGLPSMYALYDGLCYYQFVAYRGSYAELRRVESIEEASPFQFVG